jgi:hypothetical protein
MKITDLLIIGQAYMMIQEIVREQRYILFVQTGPLPGVNWSMGKERWGNNGTALTWQKQLKFVEETRWDYWKLKEFSMCLELLSELCSWKQTLCLSEILKMPARRKPVSPRKVVEELGQYLLIMEKSTVLLWAYKNELTSFGVPLCKREHP